MAIDRAQMKECIAKILEGFEYDGELTNRKVREKVEQKMGLERDALKSEEATIAAIIDEVLADLEEDSQMAMAWRSEAAHDHARVLAQCFAGADHAPGAAGFTAQLEDRIWQAASSWKGYCEVLAEKAALRGHDGCLRVLHELRGEAAGQGPTSRSSAAWGQGCLSPGSTQTPAPVQCALTSHGAVRAGGTRPRLAKLQRDALKHPKAVRSRSAEAAAAPHPTLCSNRLLPRAKGAAGAARPTAKLPPTPQQQQIAVQEQEE